jgi:hypothetical protein
MATVLTPFHDVTTAITRSFDVNVDKGLSGIFQASNTDSGTATVTLKGRVSADHTYVDVKVLSITGAENQKASVVTLFPDMSITTAGSSINVTASILH